MTKFLLDENLSPCVAKHLVATHGLDALPVLEFGAEGRTDSEVRQLARDLGRVIITMDRDFVDRRVHPFRTPPGILWLNPPRTLRTIPGENRLLDRFFEYDAPALDLDSSIVEITTFASVLIYRSG